MTDIFQQVQVAKAIADSGAFPKIAAALDKRLPAIQRDLDVLKNLDAQANALKDLLAQFEGFVAEVRPVIDQVTRILNPPVQR